MVKAEEILSEPYLATEELKSLSERLKGLAPVSKELTERILGVALADKSLREGDPAFTPLVSAWKLLEEHSEGLISFSQLKIRLADIEEAISNIEFTIAETTDRDDFIHEQAVESTASLFRMTLGFDLPDSNRQVAFAAVAVYRRLCSMNTLSEAECAAADAEAAFFEAMGIRDKDGDQ